MYDDNHQLIPHPYEKCDQSHIGEMPEHCLCGRAPEDEIHTKAEAA
jgi:hypothetical protein